MAFRVIFILQLIFHNTDNISINVGRDIEDLSEE